MVKPRSPGKEEGGRLHSTGLQPSRSPTKIALQYPLHHKKFDCHGIIRLRSQWSAWAAIGVVITITLWILFLVVRAEQYARRQLITTEEDVVTCPQAKEEIQRYEKAKASVAQSAQVNKALGAIRTNDLARCVAEMELALEENRVARSSIEPDFFEEGELLQAYQGVLKMWMDGYPLDYGRILQLRSLLAISNEDAERLEQEVQQQSDAYVI